MTLTEKEKANFDKVFDTILTPVVEECGDDILKILDNDPEMKARVEAKCERIMELRRNRKEENSNTLSNEG